MYGVLNEINDDDDDDDKQTLIKPQMYLLQLQVWAAQDNPISYN